MDSLLPLGRRHDFKAPSINDRADAGGRPHGMEGVHTAHRAMQEIAWPPAVPAIFFYPALEDQSPLVPDMAMGWKSHPWLSIRQDASGTSQPRAAGDG